MAITVEHDERRKAILEQALNVFIDDGFEGTTFQKIADRCGITRTILYLYFKNKREIFTYSIKQMLLSAEDKINVIRENHSLDSTDKITRVLFDIFDLIENNQQLLHIVVDYLLHIAKKDLNPEARIRRRTVRLRHILSSMLIKGIKEGEIKKVNVKITNDYLYNLIESAIFQLVVLKRKDLTELKEAAAFAVQQLKK